MGAVSAEAREKQRLYQRQWARENRVKRAESERRYWATHPEKLVEKQERRKPKIRAWLKADREAHPEKYRERFRKWYEQNPEQSLRRQQEWRSRNHDAVIAFNNKRRATERSAPGSGVTRKQWKDRKDEYGGRCAYCAESTVLQMEHVDPISKGGAHDIHNVVPACGRCNASKNNRTLIVWLVTRTD